MEIVPCTRNRFNFRVFRVDMASVVNTAQREDEVVAGYTGDRYCDTSAYDLNQFIEWQKVDILESGGNPLRVHHWPK